MTLQSFVLGRWVSGAGPVVPLLDPSTEEVLGEASTGGLDWSAALDYARRVGGPALRAMTFAERAERLEALVKALHVHRDALIELAVASGGNTRGDAKFDIDGGFGTAMAYVAIGKALGARRGILDGEAEALTRGPRYVGQHALASVPGVAIHLNAFNFPVWGLFEKLGPALIAGVPVLAKPALPSALLAHRVTQLAVECGALPEGALSVAFAEPEGLLDAVQPGDVVSFTGSSRVGRLVRAHPAVLDGFVRVNVEADSVNAAVLGPEVEDETFDLFLAEVAREITQKAGQKCTAVRRIFVPADRLAEVEGELSARLAAVVMGNPRSSGVKLGPVMSAAQRQHVSDGILRLDGACTRVLGGGRGQPLEVPEGKGFFVEPTLFRAPNADVGVVHHEEVFGPVATLVPYDGSPESAGALVARGRGGLCASVYSDDKAFLERALPLAAPWVGRLNVGSAKIAPHSPGHGAVLPSSCHGGPGRAGGGQELGGRRGLELYLQRTAYQGDRPLLEKLLDG